jgi:hypothetical protein
LPTTSFPHSIRSLNVAEKVFFKGCPGTNVMI